jgi:CubicO group peptidase (beta-lactamase class C family)
MSATFSRRRFLELSALSVAGALTLKANEKLDTLQQHIVEGMKATNVPGLSIAIIKNGKVAWRKGFGVKDRTTNEPVTNDTMFEAASMSKPVFAYTVMKLAETGKISLDEPLTRYTTARFLDGDPRLDQITARHVLCHTTGFPNWRSDKEPMKIAFDPGSKWSYSGEGYNYLQTVVAELTMQDFDSYMEQHLFKPFHMKSSGYVWNDDFAKRMARPHDSKGQPMEQKKSSVTDIMRYGSAGALLSTPTDYAKFLIEVMRPKSPDAAHLTNASWSEMLRPQMKAQHMIPSDWALGWQVMHVPQGDLIGHGGDNDGFHCLAAASIPKKMGVVVMTNGENGANLIWLRLTTDLLALL